MTGLKAWLARRFVSSTLPDIEKFAPKGIPFIPPSPNSVIGRAVPEVIALYGRPRLHTPKALTMLPPFLKAAYYARQSRTSIRRNPTKPSKVADESCFTS